MEIDVSHRIKTYWENVEETMGRSNIECIREQLSNSFVNPSAEHPENVAWFLAFLDLSFLVPFLKKIYPRFERIEENVFARVKFLLYMILTNRRSLRNAYLSLKANPQYVKLLGFKDGKLQSYETLRAFINEKLSDSLLEEMFYLITIKLKELLGEYGINFGERRGEDATVIRALPNDAEAEYNDYYKVKGYKKDIVIDLDTGLPLAYADIGINEHEGACLIPLMARLATLGFTCKEQKVDGKYPTYENIATAKIVYGAELIYLPHKDWVFNEKGSEEAIKREYQKYWKDVDFRVNASIHYMLRFLYNKGKIEHVGAYYRNKVLLEYKKDPDGYKMQIGYGERSKNEWFNDYVKRHLGFDLNLPKRGKRAAYRYTTMCLIAINAVALTRVQHGVTDNLGSVAYLV